MEVCIKVVTLVLETSATALTAGGDCPFALGRGPLAVFVVDLSLRNYAIG